MTRFLLIRHAITDSVGKFLSGRADGVSLNNQGYLQAENLAKKLQHTHIDAVFSSPLLRAKETAEPLANFFNLTVQTDPSFNEIDFGEWTNVAIDILRNDTIFRQFNSFRSNTRIPGGELMAEAQIRIVTGLQSICGEYPDKTVAVVSHFDMIKSALIYYMGVHIDHMQRIEIDPCSVSIIELLDDTALVKLINYTGDIKM